MRVSFGLGWVMMSSAADTGMVRRTASTMRSEAARGIGERSRRKG